MIYVIWLICAVVCAAVASDKGQNAVGWFIGGLLFGVFALIAVFMIENNKDKPEDKPRHV